MIDFGAVIKIAFGVCFLFVLLSIVAMLQGGMRDNMDAVIYMYEDNESITINTFEATSNLSIHTSANTPYGMNILNVWVEDDPDVHLETTSWEEVGETQWTMTNQTYENNTDYKVEYEWNDIGQSLAGNITEEGMNQTEEISEWGPTLVTLGISMILLFLVIGIYLYFKKKEI